MRIDSRQIVSAEMAKSITDLIGRLDVGDVVRAKVLDISSDEAVLRLSDGSIIKASLAENLEAKVGQVLTLTVTSKAEGNLYLESAKEFNQANFLKSDILKSMLEALGLSSDSKNLSLMSEFVKADISPTAEQMNAALSLLNGNAEIDAEKAVFLINKEIHPDKETLNSIVKLLQGELRLGDILKDITKNIDDIRNIVVNNNTDSDIQILEKLAAVINKAVADEMIESAKMNSSGEGEAAKATVSSGSEITARTVGETAADNALFESSQANQPQNNQSAHALENSQHNQNTIAVREENNNLQSVVLQDSDDAENIQSDSNTTILRERPLDSTPANHIAETQDKNVLEPKSEQVWHRDFKSDLNHNLAKLKDLVEEIFIKIDSKGLSQELDVHKMKNELNKKLDLLRAAVFSSELSELSAGKSITDSVRNLSDIVKAMNHLFNNNIVYYQLPINISGHKTSAEIYIMKNKQGKKKINPQDTVLFLSLDTINIGRIESLIVVKRKNVSISFRTEKQQIIDFAKENIKSLYTGLEDGGYKLVNMKYELLDTPTSPAGIEKLITEIVNGNRNKVDLRI